MPNLAYEPKTGHDLTRVPLHYEQDADRVADRVVATDSARLPPASARLPMAASRVPDSRDVPAPVRETLRSPGLPLDPSLRSFMEPRLGYDLGRVRLHVEERSATQIGAQAYAAGSHVAFSPGRFNPHTVEGKRLIAHELAHVVQGSLPGSEANALFQMKPETWLRGEAESGAVPKPGGFVHDFGDGLYLTQDPGLAADYANVRAGETQSAPRIRVASFDRGLLGRLLDLTTDPRWKAFLAERAPISGLSNEQLIRMANENYWSLFQSFLSRHGLKLGDFDAIIGPEFVRQAGAKTQLCIRNPSIIAQVEMLLGPAAAEGPAAAAARFSVRRNFQIVASEQGPGGGIAAEVEVKLGDGLDAMNRRVVANGGRPIPGEFILRVTSDAKGALISVNPSAADAAPVAEALAQEILRTIPRASPGVSPWVRGLSWAGLVLFGVVTGYRLATAQPEDRPRVGTQAGGGFLGAAAGAYLVCNLALGIETLGWSLLICSAVAGVPAGMAGEAAADVGYDELKGDDDEIRARISKQSLAAIAAASPEQKLSDIFGLMRGWISEEDVATIERILASVSTPGEMAALREIIWPYLTTLMTSIGQRTRVRVALAR